MKSDNVRSEIGSFWRFESFDSKAKMGWDLSLCKTMGWNEKVMQKSSEYENQGKPLQGLFI